MTTSVRNTPSTAARPAGLSPVLPRKRRAGLVAAGFLLVLVGAVVAYLVAVSVGVTRPYLALARDVPYGAAITVDDLTVVNLHPATGLSLVAAADRAQVVGLHATNDLHAGTLLSRRDLAAVTIPAPGQQVLALDLKPGQIPGSVRAGTTVLLAIVPADGGAGAIGAADSDFAGTPTIAATVVDGPQTQPDNDLRVDVAVAASDATTVAAMAAADRIVLIVTGRG